MEALAMRKISLFLRYLILTSLFLVFALWPRLASADKQDTYDLKDVWERVRQSGSYEFSADVTQSTTTPDRAIKVGPPPKKRACTWRARVTWRPKSSI